LREKRAELRAKRSMGVKLGLDGAKPVDDGVVGDTIQSIFEV
jgi:hypothetical protein